MSTITGFRHTKDFSAIMDCTDFCDHCSEDDLSKAIGFSYEKDSFGYVGTEIVCQECKESQDKEAAKQETCCHDCNNKVKVGETTEWRWYDFYAAQGDTPLVICNNCWGESKHQVRMAKDSHDEAMENGWDDNDGDDINW